MKILVIGGMHGNEMLGIDLVKSLQEDPLENIDSVLANEEAIKVNKRFVKQDLNRSFPVIMCIFIALAVIKLPHKLCRCVTKM